MPKFYVGYEFSAWNVKEIEAKDEEEAFEILQRETDGIVLSEWFEGQISLGDMITPYVEENEE